MRGLNIGNDAKLSEHVIDLTELSRARPILDASIFAQKSGAISLAVPKDSVPEIINRSIGCGYDSTLNAVRSPLVTGTLVRETITDGAESIIPGIAYAYTVDQSSYLRAVSQSVQLRAKFGGFGGSGSYESTRSTATSSYEMHLIASVRRVDLPYLFKSSSIQLDDTAHAILKKWELEPNQCVIQFGDEVITGIVPGEEILIDLAISTRTAEEVATVKASLAASYAALVSGEGNFSDTIKTTSASFATKLSIIGQSPRLEKLPLDPATIESVMLTVTNGTTGRSVVLKYIVDRMRSVMLDGMPLRFVNSDTTQKLRAAATQCDIFLDWFALADVDAEYVALNPNEFEQAVRDVAQSDAVAIANNVAKLQGLRLAVAADYEATGTVGAAVTDILKFKLPELSRYPRKVPPPAPPQAPPPRPKPAHGGEPSIHM